jgi:carbon starvation protein
MGWRWDKQNLGTVSAFGQSQSSPIFSQDIRVGFLAAARNLTDKINTGLIEDSKISITHQLIFNQKLDAFITLFLLIILWTVVIDMLRISFFKKN